ncbi:MAG TPA: cytochrome P450, partial [Streptosporangiaceae bacterium]|nr:cytochrome P450 [Streptosporangiaceae bacterium]
MTEPSHGSPLPEDQHARGGQSGQPASAEAGTFALYGPRLQTELAELYSEMSRRHGAVAPVLLEGDVPAWLVLGYREVHYVTANPNLFGRDSRRWNQWPHIPPDWPLRPLLAFQESVLDAEGAEHRRRAGAINDALAGVDPFELRTHCERVADALIDVFAGSGEADLVPDYANQIPLTVMVRLVGLAESEGSSLMQDFFTMVSGGADAIGADARNRARMQRLLDLKREQPGSDVATRLISHQAGLSDKEIVEDLMGVMGAGQVPTSCWIG